ncbi:MAG TPA: hypothetical protein PLQ00_17240, partial [Thermoguttaceae bacterium]|nr:hypothetical protein [Thermoguttaceae bacterium]
MASTLERPPQQLPPPADGASHVPVRIQEPWYVRETLTRLWDGLATMVGFWLALQWGQPGDNGSHLWLGGVGVLVFYITAEIAGLYRNWRGIPVAQEIFCALWTWAFTLLAMGGVGLAAGWTDWLPRKTFLLWTAVVVGFLVIGRLGVRAVRRAIRALGYNIRGFAVVGVNRLGFQLASSIEQAPELGLRCLGFYDDRSPD